MRARDNPFAVQRVLTIRYRLQNGSWDDLLGRLAALNYRAAIVGDEGAGKTTLMEDLGDRLAESEWTVTPLRLNRNQPRFPRGFLTPLLARLGPRDILLLDGAEQMGRFAWWRFLRRTRRCGGLIVTSHRSGLLPTLIHCTTTPQLLREIVRELLDHRADDLQPMLDSLFWKHGGNLRNALRDLYDYFAAERTPGQLDSNSATILPHGFRTTTDS
jgi:hypothetical protein